MARPDADLALRVATSISRAHGHFAVLFDADLKVIWGSETIAEILGVVDPVGLSVLDVVHPDDLAVVSSGLAHHVDHRDDYADYRPDWRPEPFEVRVGSGGEWCNYEVSLFNHLEDPDVGAFLVVGHAEVDRRDLPLAIDLLGSGAALDEVLPVIARYIDSTLQGSRCEVIWWDDSLHRVAAPGATVLPEPPTELLRTVRRSGEPAQLDDLEGLRSVPDELRALRLVPVGAPGRPEVVACLAIWSPMPVGVETGPQRPVHQAVRLASLAVVDHHAKTALRWEATHDNLTGLTNRAGFDADLATQDAGCALLYIDLDDFKPVNDLHGHHAGDAVLVAVARRLESHTRDIDTVARLGGDEFAVLIPAPVTKEMATDVAARVIEAIARPISVAGRTITVGASVGLAMEHGRLDPQSLTRRADEALYSAKEAGKQRMVLAAANQ